MRGLYDTIVYLLEKLLLWSAQLLERLDAFLASQLGPNWWSSTEYQRSMNGDK
jgi:hypothetical protein